MSQDEESKVIRNAPIMIMIKTLGSLFSFVIFVSFFLSEDLNDILNLLMHLFDMSSMYFVLLVLAFILLFMLIILFWYFDWRTKSLMIKDRELFYCSGIINKRRLTISYKNISTVDLTSPLLYRFLNLSKLKIDSNSVGAAAGQKTDITLGLSRLMADQIRSMILNKVHGEQSEDIKEYLGETLYKADAGKILWHALLSMLSISVFFLSAAVIPIIFLFDYSLVIFLIYIMGVIGIMGFVIAVSMFTHGGMELIKEFSRIKISYGILDKKSVSMPIHKINGVIITQNILQKFFGYCNMRVLSAGYGDEGSEAMAYVALSIRPDEAKRIKEIIIGKENSEYTNVTPSTKMSVLFYLPTIIMGLIVIVSAVFSVVSFGGKIYWIPSIPIFAITFLSGRLRYRNSQMSFQKNYFRVNIGGIYNQLVYTRRERCQSITYRQGILQRIFGGGNLAIHLYAPVGKNNITIRNIDKEVLNEFIHL